MQIRFPRRIQLGFRPWYGLSLRQLFYVVCFAVGGGAAILLIPTDFLIRVLIGLAIMSVGIALAFFRKNGMSIEQWIATWLKFALHPQKRVWTRGEETARHKQVADIQLDEFAPSASDAPIAPPAPPPVAESDAPPVQNLRLLRPTPRVQPTTAPAVVFLDLATLLAFFALAVYMLNGGWDDMQSWFAVQFGP
jgi:hypothetical protein